MVLIIIYKPSYRRGHFLNSCSLFCLVQMVFLMLIFLFNSAKYVYKLGLHSLLAMLI